MHTLQLSSPALRQLTPAILRRTRGFELSLVVAAFGFGEDSVCLSAVGVGGILRRKRYFRARTGWCLHGIVAVVPAGDERWSIIAG